MKTTNKLGILALISATLLGCTTETQTTLPESAKESESGKKVVSHATAKPGAPISMSYKILTDSPKAGEEIAIEVNFDSPIKAAVKSEMTSAEKLTWMNSKTNWDVAYNKSGQRDDLPQLKVVAPEDGVFYIRFVASVEHEGKTLRKPFIIPVTVGDGKVELEAPGEVVIDDKGQKVIVQKAGSDN